MQYSAAGLPAFHSKIENQVILGRTHFFLVNSCDRGLIEIFYSYSFGNLHSVYSVTTCYHCIYLSIVIYLLIDGTPVVIIL